MNRRDTLLALLALSAAPGVAYAQPVPARIALISSGKAAESSGEVDSYLNGVLRKVGLTERKDYVIEYFWAEGEVQHLPALLETVVARKPSIIIVFSVPQARAAQQATKTIPILLQRASSDPVADGLVESLAHPGGNTTGFAGMSDHVPKVVDIIRQVLPKAKRVAVLTPPLGAEYRRLFDSFRRAAADRAMTADAFEAETPERIAAAFSALARTRPDAIFVMLASMIAGQSAHITALSIAHKIPVFAASASQAEDGALVGYGPSPNTRDYRIEDYIKKILAGAKPADLPVVQPSTFELVLNRKTARALGIRIPSAFLLSVDRICLLYTSPSPRDS